MHFPAQKNTSINQSLNIKPLKSIQSAHLSSISQIVKNTHS